MHLVVEIVIFPQLTFKVQLVTSGLPKHSFFSVNLVNLKLQNELCKLEILPSTSL